MVLLISSIVALIKFNKTSGAVAVGAEAKAQVWAEEMTADASIQRQTNYKEFVDATTDEDGNRIDIISHDKFMKEMEGD